MTARDLLAQLRERGVQLKASDADRLIIDAPKGVITQDLRDALATYKPELLEILKQEQIAEPPVAVTPKVSQPEMQPAVASEAAAVVMPKVSEPETRPAVE